MQNYDEWARLAVARLNTYPHDFIFNAGEWEGNNLGLIYEVKRGTPIGRFFVKMEQEYFTAIKDGTLTKILTESE